MCATLLDVKKTVDLIRFSHKLGVTKCNSNNTITYCKCFYYRNDHQLKTNLFLFKKNDHCNFSNLFTIHCIKPVNFNAEIQVFNLFSDENSGALFSA